MSKQLLNDTARKRSINSALAGHSAIYGYVPDEAVQLVAQELSIFPVEIYGVLTLYPIYLMPRAETHYQSVRARPVM